MHSPKNHGVPEANAAMPVSPPVAAQPPPAPYVDIPPVRNASSGCPELQVETMNAMRLKPPELDTGDVHTFFFALENWFDAANIPPNHHHKRFNILKTQIPMRVLPELRHLLENVPANDRYEAAKGAIVQHFEESQRSRLHRLLSEMSLGDRKPSQLLAEMRRTANGAMTDSMLVDLWIGRLPPHVQSAVIAASPNVDDKMKVADAVMDSFALYHRTGPYQSVAEVRNEEFDRLSRQVAELSHRLEAVLRDSNRRETPRTRSRSRPHRQNQANSHTTDGLCYYHQRYGQAARNCRAPCSFDNRSRGSHPPAASS